MDQGSQNCPHWCDSPTPHRLNHHHTVHQCVVDAWNRVSIDLHRGGDDPTEIFVWLHGRGDELTGEPFTPGQVMLLSRVLGLLDFAQLQAFTGRLGAAAVLAGGERL